jgi:O-antigen ligase
MEYANDLELYETGISQPPPQRSTDVQFPAVVNVLLLAVWAVFCCIGFAVILVSKMPVAGVVVIAVPTFIIMVIKPTFSLALMIMVLSAGAGVGVGGTFALERGVGIAFAVSFVLNILISRPILRIHNKALWLIVLYTFWVFFVSLSSPYVGLELGTCFTQFQMLILILIVYWILETNGENSFRWVLRTYVFGTLCTIILIFITGAAMRQVQEGEETGGRYTATLGTNIVNANMMAGLIAMAFFAAVYLFVRDRALIWRLMYGVAILFLPIMMIKTGSRGGLIAFVFTLTSPLLFIRQVVRKPALALLLLMIMVFLAGSASFLLKSQELSEEVSSRLTNIEKAKESLDYRLSLIRTTLSGLTRRPFGSGRAAWMERSGLRHYPHNDLFFALALYGIPGGLLFLFFAVLLVFTVKRMPVGIEKLYARAVLTFLLVSGLSMAQLGKKYYWAFLVFVICMEKISYKHADTHFSTYKNEIEKTEDSLSVYQGSIQ